MAKEALQNNLGQEMFDLVAELFPICRSITGNGVRETLKILNGHIDLKFHEVPTGTKVFDWTVPKEWNIRNAYVINPEGKKIIDFKENNLHVLGYSIPVDKYVSLSKLQEHLHSIEEQPDAIPYVTSYFKEHWGFCISQRKRNTLREGKYRVVIDSELKDGSLTYGECIIPGSSEKEIFLSTYICHPSMANNELSGPVVTTYLAKWIKGINHKYTYRIVFLPETIGSISYLSRNLEKMKKDIIAGFNISCVGDDKEYSYLPSRYGNTLADRVVLIILKNRHPDFIKYSYLDRGSDERQYCSAGIDLPVVCLMRSKYGEYPEYHTSLDDLNFIKPNGLNESFELYKECIELLERNVSYRMNCYGEPQLNKRGLYPSLSKRGSRMPVIDMMNFIAYADGSNDLIDISELINAPVSELYPIVEKLKKAGLIDEVS